MKKNCNTENEFSDNKDRLLSFIHARVQNKEVAKDIMQDTFVKFEECCQKGCSCEYPKSYLFKMALNTIADFFKKKNKN